MGVTGRALGEKGALTEREYWSKIKERARGKRMDLEEIQPRLPERRRKRRGDYLDYEAAFLPEDASGLEFILPIFPNSAKDLVEAKAILLLPNENNEVFFLLKRTFKIGAKSDIRGQWFTVRDTEGMKNDELSLHDPEGERQFTFKWLPRSHGDQKLLELMIDLDGQRSEREVRVKISFTGRQVQLQGDPVDWLPEQNAKVILGDEKATRSMHCEN